MAADAACDITYSCVFQIRIYSPLKAQLLEADPRIIQNVMEFMSQCLPKEAFLAEPMRAIYTSPDLISINFCLMCPITFSFPGLNDFVRDMQSLLAGFLVGHCGHLGLALNYREIFEFILVCHSQLFAPDDICNIANVL